MTPRGAPVALVARPDGGFSLAGASVTDLVDVAAVAEFDAAERPRWVWWTGRTAEPLVRAGLRISTCWDVAAVHRLQHGGWHAEPARAWAAVHGLSVETIPGLGQLDLLAPDGDDGGDPESPLRPDGHLRAEWAGGGWSRTPARAGRWAELALEAARLQRAAITEPRHLATAHAESAAEVLCLELELGGLPVDRAAAEVLIRSFVGARPSDAAEAVRLRRRRDEAVLAHAPGIDADLRNPAQVKSLLAQLGFDLPDTRSWRLEPFVGAHPVIEELLSWRKAERIATTYGYAWLDENVGADGRLRGGWSGSDGAAGRMTAGAGLHNLPAELRSAVAAEPGHVLVRADLGQIEPRVLAAVSGDRALSSATADDDLYAPVAARLNVERPVAKVAVLAAMYGQTSGAAGEALRGMESAYPTAMRFLRAASEQGRAGSAVRTYGGRTVPMWREPAGLDEAGRRAVAAARGRFARNATVQGAAAEFFKAWALTVRARTAPLGAEIVLCLHDELLLQAPVEHGPAVAAALHECLAEAAARWFGGAGVRFVAEVSVIGRWSEAKA